MRSFFFFEIFPADRFGESDSAKLEPRGGCGFFFSFFVCGRNPAEILIPRVIFFFDNYG